ncbi:MAG: hypothetical protein RL728_1145 [Bacteroidota bacterium]|jgi:hypothetical protein
MKTEILTITEGQFTQNVSAFTSPIPTGYLIGICIFTFIFVRYFLKSEKKKGNNKS